MATAQPLPAANRRAAIVSEQRHYTRHRPEESLLYRVIERHAPAFFTHLAERDGELPGFVRDEFDSYLRCGRLEHGFLRVKCNHCRHEHLVAFSCKCRGFCPSCASRRMVETAAYLVEEILPPVPIRQWVVSFPWPLRLLFAAHPEVLTRVIGVISRAVSTSLIKRAGLTRRAGGETGVITFIQRFGSALNLNIHLHMLIPDGAYTFHDEHAHFHPAPPPTDLDIAKLLDTLIGRLTRTLVRTGALLEDPEQPWLDIDNDGPLGQLAASAVRYRIAIGPLAGSKTMTLHSPDAVSTQTLSPKPLTAARDGFSLNAAVACQPHQRDKLERLCRYVSRGPIALERLTIDGDGLVVYELKHPFRDGTTHVLFEPLDFIARLAALIPRPRLHLIRYHGLFAPNAKHRHLIVTRNTQSSPLEANPQGSSPKHSTPMTWMQRLRRVFDIDLRHCPLCGGDLHVIAAITDPALIPQILAHRPDARAPPGDSVH